MERWSEGIIVRLFSNLIGTRFIGKRYEHGPNWGEWWQNDWCFERYNCPHFTTPDEAGNVILDYGISIED